MSILKKIKFSLLPYLSYKRIYTFNDKALEDKRNYWIKGNAYYLNSNRWETDNGIPLGIYTAKLQLPLDQRVNITGLCEYCFALIEEGREKELPKIVDFLRGALVAGDYRQIPYLVWRTYLKEDRSVYFMDGMGQGQMLSMLVCYQHIYQDERIDEILIKLSNSFLIDLTHPDGFVSFKEGETIIEEYSRHHNFPQVLNGWIYGIIGLYDYYTYARDAGLIDPWLDQKLRVFESTVETLAQNIEKYNVWFWSTYDQPRKITQLASIHYHMLHIAELEVMARITEKKVFSHFARMFKFQFYNPFSRVLAFTLKTFYVNFRRHGWFYRLK